MVSAHGRVRRTHTGPKREEQNPCPSLDRGASNLKPSLDMPDQIYRKICALIPRRARKFQNRGMCSNRELYRFAATLFGG